MEKPHDKVLAKYLNGECSREEQSLVEEWFASLDAQEDDSRLTDLLAENALQEKMLTEIKKRIDLPKPHTKPARSYFLVPMRIAATVRRCERLAGSRIGV